MELTNEQMNQVNGGVNWIILSGISAAIVYVVGFLSGYTNPSKCNN